jgi:hypothetical protein
MVHVHLAELRTAGQRRYGLSRVKQAIGIECLLDGERVFRADLHPAMAANPFLAFRLRATRSGTLRFRWRDQHGEESVETRELVVDG